MTKQISGPEYIPAFRVTAEGKDITNALRRSLLSLTLTDYGGTSARADTLKITLLSETLPLPSKGARLRLGLGFNDRLTDKGWFVVSDVASSGPPRKIEINATAAPMNAEKQRGDVLAIKTRSWHDLLLVDLVKTIAGENGLIPRVAACLANYHIDHLDQVAESDANLLSRLARELNAVSKPTGGYWLFLKQGAGQTAGGRPLSAVTITPAQVTRWSYVEKSRGNSTASNGAEKGKESGRVKVRYYDAHDGKTRVASVEYAGATQENPYTQPSKKYADLQAKARKAQAVRNASTMTLSGPCRLSHIPLTAECRIVTSGFGRHEDGHWVIESLEFSLGTAGLNYTCSLVIDPHPAKSTPRR